jgi:hypothetical protein
MLLLLLVHYVLHAHHTLMGLIAEDVILLILGIIRLKNVLKQLSQQLLNQQLLNQQLLSQQLLSQQLLNLQLNQ